MAVLFAANEPESFEISAVADIDTNVTAGYFNSGYARAGIEVDAVTEYIKAAFTGNTDVWCSFYVTGGNYVGSYWITMGDSDTDQGILRLSGTSTVERYDGTTWQTVTNTMNMVNNILTRIDIHIVISDTGSIDIYQDGTSVCSYSGDTNVTDVNDVGFATFTTTRAGFDASFSEVVIATDDTRSYRVITMYPNGAGTNSDWSGAYTDVDDIGTTHVDFMDDSDFIVTSSAADVSTFALTDPTTNNYNVHAVVVGCRALIGGTGPQNLQVALATTSATDFSANLSGLSTSVFAPGYNVWSTNPFTSTDWSIADLASLEAGVKATT